MKDTDTFKVPKMSVTERFQQAVMVHPSSSWFWGFSLASEKGNGNIHTTNYLLVVSYILE